MSAKVGVKVSRIYGLVAAVAICLLLTMPALAAVPHRVAARVYGPYADEIEFSLVEEETEALEKLNTGDLHVWLWGIETPEGLATAEEMPNVDYIMSYSGMFDLFVNPLPEVNITGVGPRFNPFGIREVREALNWLVDREYITMEIMGGLGVPQYTVYAPYIQVDYARTYPKMLELEIKYSHDLAKANETIYAALTDAGCTLENGKWYDPDGNLIELYFVIRIEDVRRDIGDYVAGLLEELGFTVHRDYAPVAKAIPKVYGGVTDWHLYTEGWAWTSIVAYDDETPYYMYCSPWTGAVFEYYQPSDELVSLAEKLLNREYADAAERLEWIEELTELCLSDSTRVWLVAQGTPFPYNTGVTNVAYDLVAGCWSLYTLRTTRYPGVIGGTLKVGIKVFPEDAFNPVGGFKWLYSAHVRDVIIDPYGVYTHPHMGTYIPLRASYSVTTMGPNGTLPVPSDALIFDPATKDWKAVGSGVTATSAVTFNFDFGKWHHGEDITMADVFAAIAHGYLVAYDGSDIYDAAAVTPGLEVFVSTCKGIKVLNDTALTVYIDFWHLDPSFIAGQADVWPSVPWEIYALMDAAVKDHELAFSDTMAKEWGVDWLDLARGPSLDILEDYLATLKAENYIPDYMTDADLPSSARVTSSMATARWDAVQTWYSNYGHFMISNGPFYLDHIDPAAKKIYVKAFSEYVYTPDHWDWLVTPKVPEISANIPPSVVCVPGLTITIPITSTLRGVPYQNVEMKFLLVSPEGEVVIEKTPAWDEKIHAFKVTLTEEELITLPLGTYTAYIVAVPAEAAIPKVISGSMLIIPLEVYVESEITAINATLSSQIAELQDTITDLETELAATRAATRSAMYVGVAVGVVGIAIAAAALAMAFRRS